MGRKFNKFAAIFGAWLPMKVAEFAVFLIVFIVSAELLEHFRSGGVGYSSRIALGVAIFYGLVLLYWPLSLALYSWLWPNPRQPAVAEILFFLVHSVVVISIAYNGVFGFSDRISYLSPLVLAWGTVCIVKTAFVLFSVTNSG